ncbi:hypothetical protein [Brevibacillus sp. VP]|uniref:hypothetical protein n=1 Tax=unclassified Brevibacillus TaxID=2684853 RepID=UPI000E2E5D52|nr:hypothetical protein [Brevibacillus sp. VP]RFB35721.1 hypothetical protein DZB91_09515 [Brevibacillus sp. VP]
MSNSRLDYLEINVLTKNIEDLDSFTKKIEELITSFFGEHRVAHGIRLLETTTFEDDEIISCPNCGFHMNYYDVLNLEVHILSRNGKSLYKVKRAEFSPRMLESHGQVKCLNRECKYTIPLAEILKNNLVSE